MSALSFREYVELIACTYLTYKNEPEKKEIDRSKYTKEQLKALDDAMKIETLGVLNDSKILNLKFSVPLKVFSEKVYNFDYLLTLYVNYKSHGLLPFSGTISEQPNKIIEVFNIINSVVNELQIKEQKKQEQQYKSQKR